MPPASARLRRRAPALSRLCRGYQLPSSAALAGGADNITDRRRPTAPAPNDAEPVDKTPARSFVALPSPSTSQKDDEEAEDFFSTLLQGQQTPAATPAAQPAVPQIGRAHV